MPNYDVMYGNEVKFTSTNKIESEKKLKSLQLSYSDKNRKYNDGYPTPPEDTPYKMRVSENFHG